MAQTPTDPTKAQVWITKGIDDLDFEFYFPQGPKGDPGGFTTGTQLLNNNLNAITVNGLYRQDNSANATLVNNYPVTAPGVMQVMERSAGSIVQVYYTITGTPTYEARTHYVRVLQATVWSPWRTFASTRVDQTAGRAIYQWDELNNREQLIYGDTGWRNMNAIVDPNFVPEGVGVQLRRIGNRVTCDVRGKLTAVPTVPTQQLIMAIPVGFRGVNYAVYPSGISGTSVISMGYPSNNIDLYLYSTANFVNASTRIAQASWTTDEVWPTTLPGTANGTIPNL